MSGDTPYILRMEMVKLAQDRASQKFHHEWERAVRKAEASKDPSLITEVPEYPSVTEILSEAEQIKKFVNRG